VREVLPPGPGDGFVVEMLDRAVDRCHLTGVPVTVVRIPGASLGASGLRKRTLRDTDILCEDGAQTWAILGPGAGAEQSLQGLLDMAAEQGVSTLDVAEWTIQVADAAGLLATLRPMAAVSDSAVARAA